MHKFNSEQAQKLDSEERHNLLPASQILKEIGLEEGMLAADVGCGTGFFTILAAEILGYEGKIYAFDLQKQMLTYLRMKIEKPNIVPILSEENKLPLKDKLLDFALVAFVLHEANSPNSFLEEIKRVLKQKGSLAIIDWIKQSEKDGPPKDERLSQEDVVKQLTEKNFDIEKSEVLNNSHYLVVGKVHH